MKKILLLIGFLLVSCAPLEAFPFKRVTTWTAVVAIVTPGLLYAAYPQKGDELLKKGRSWVTSSLQKLWKKDKEQKEKSA